MTLNSYLTRLIWLCILPPVLLAAWLAFDKVRADQSDRDVTAANITKTFAREVDQHLNARIGALRMLAASPLAGDASRRKDFYAEMQSFHASFGSHVILADTEMQMLLNTRAPFGAALPRLPKSTGRTAAPVALETGAPAVGDVLFGPVAREPLVAIAVPGKRDGKTDFLLLTTFETARFQSLIDQVALPSGWSLALLDGKDEPIARSAPPATVHAAAGGDYRKFAVKSAVSLWSTTLAIPDAVYRAPMLKASAGLLITVIVIAFAGVLTGILASGRLANAVAALAQGPPPGAPAPDIDEIAAARRLLDEAAAKRETAEAALKESEQRFRLAASTGNVWDFDFAANAFSIAGEFWRGLGYEDGDIGNLTAMIESVMHPEDRARWRQAMTDHVSRRLPFDIDCRIRTKSGEYRWFNAKGQARWNADGRATYIAGTAFDITERKLAEQTNREQFEKLARSETETRLLLAHAEKSRTALLGILEDQQKAETALRESEERFASAFHTSPAAITITRIADGKFIDANQAFLDVFGFSREEVIGHTSIDLGIISAEQRAKLIQSQIASGGLQNAELLTQSKSGRPVNLLFSSKPMQLAGEPHHVTTMIDITARKQAEAALAENEQRYRALFDVNPSPLWVYDTQTWKFIAVNEAAVRQYGYSAGEFSMMTILEIYPEASHAAVRARIRNLSEVRHIETRHRRRDGTEFPVELYGAPVTLDDRACRMVLAIDITERKRTEQQLRDSEERLRLSTELADVAVWEYDFATNEMSRSGNHDRLYGLPWQDKWDINTFLAATHPDDRGISNEIIMKSAAPGGPDQYHFDFRVIYPDQSVHWLMAVAEVVERDPQGQAAIVRGCLIDVSERKHGESRLAAQRHVLEMIASGRTLAETLDALVRTVEVLAPGVLGSILLMDEDGVHVRHGAAPSLPASFNQAIDGEPIGENAGSCGTAAYRRAQVIVEDIATDPLWDNYREVALQHGLRACWSTPVFDEDQQTVLGTFALYFRAPRRPAEYHLQLIETLTHIAAIAITKAHEEASLKASEERYRRIVETAQEGIWVIDADSNTSFVNQRMAEMLGYAADEMIGAPLTRFMDEEGRRIAAANLERRRAGIAEQHEFSFLRKDGSTIWALLSTNPLTDGQGNYTGALAMVADITARKEAEEALRDSEARIRNIFEQASDGIFMISKENRYLEANRSGLEMLGYTRDELLQMSVADILAPRERPRLAVEPAEMMAGKPHLAEWEHLRKDGSTFPAEVSARKLGDDSYLAIVRDLSMRKQAEEALRARENQLSLIFDNAYDIIFVIEVAPHDCYRFASVNPRFLEATGLSENQVVGKPVEEVIPQPALALILEKYREAIRTGQNVQWEETSDYPAGRKVGLVTIAPVFDADGTCIQLIGTVYDITERKQVEVTLRENAMRQRQLSRRLTEVEEHERRAISHELHDRIGQNLAALKLILDIVRKQMPQDALRTAGARLNDASALIQAVITQVRDVMADLRPVALDDYGLVPALQNYAEQFSKRLGIPIAINGENIVTRPPLNVEMTLFRIAQEALNNIAKHAQASRVDILVEQRAGRLRMEIRDDGIGFSLQSAKAGRATWGMSTMRERAEAIGAIFSVESKPGAGTRVIAECEGKS